MSARLFPLSLIRLIVKFVYDALCLLVLWLFILLSLLCAGLSLAGLKGGENWLLDLTNHFKPFYLLAQLVLLCGFLLMRKYFWMLFSLGFIIVGLIQLLPLYVPATDGGWKQPVVGRNIRVVQLNVCAPLKDYSRMTAFLKRERPDIVTLEECADRCVAFLKNDGVLAQYSFRLRKTESRLMLLSRFPFRENVLPPLHANPAVAFVRLNVEGQSVNLLMMHSTRPSSGVPFHRNQVIQFHQIARILHQNSVPVLMAGDFNTTPWGASYQQLVRESGLRNSMAGFGFQPSFPAFIPKVHWWSMPVVPIDHVLVSEQWIVKHRKVGPRVGSDHLPVTVDLGLRKRRGNG